MKFVLCFLVLCVISAYAFQDREFPYEYENQQEVARNDCIAKHHECTSNKEGCCDGKIFKYKCACYKVIDESGKDTERCACETPGYAKVADMFANVGHFIAS
uniref:U56-Deinotoxin-Dsu1b_1 n=1 Tax=Deinopis subrufa TaxID=1905329 RepID=A0A4V2H9U4_DEISU